MEMTKDKALEELFLAQKPHFSDNADFMAALTQRLDAVEFIKQHQEATIRRYKMLMVAAFVVGIISGATAIARSEERRVGKECRSRWSPYH